MSERAVGKPDLGRIVFRGETSGSVPSQWNPTGPLNFAESAGVDFDYLADFLGIGRCMLRELVEPLSDSWIRSDFGHYECQFFEL